MDKNQSKLFEYVEKKVNTVNCKSIKKRQNENIVQQYCLHNLQFHMSDKSKKLHVFAAKVATMSATFLSGRLC